MRDYVDENVAIEIHDSTLESIDARTDPVVAVLSAYVHRSLGRPGIDAGTGWSQSLQLRFYGGSATGSLGAVPMELLNGRLEVASEVFASTIPMPLNRTGPVRIELLGWNEQRIVIEGKSVEATLVGQARYIEQFTGVNDAAG